VNEWLQDAAERIASLTGDDPDALRLAPDEIDELLELARIAAHESGERINAPLVCYLVGLARGRRGGDLPDVVDAVVGKRP
jgi:hypothetical protein